MKFVIIKLDLYCIRMRWSLASQVSQGTGKQDQGEKEALYWVSEIGQHPFNQPFSHSENNHHLYCIDGINESYFKNLAKPI